MTYCLFAGDTYYPEGGANDFVLTGSYDECLATMAAITSDWWHIARADTMQIVAHHNMDIVQIAAGDRG